MDENYSIVHYFSEGDKHKCGYCKNTDTSITYGMWAQCLTVQDYQDLIDRGWRRSGYYCYKPIMDITCCPMYTIKCEALNFKPSKSQKKILKRLNKFLGEGLKEKDTSSQGSSGKTQEISAPMEIQSTDRKHDDVDLSKISTSQVTYIPEEKSSIEESNTSKKPKIQEPPSKDNEKYNYSSPNIITPESSMYNLKDNFKIPDYTPGEGVDITRQPCKKAKMIRLERKKQKMAAAGLVYDISLKSKNDNQCGKSLEEFISEAPKNPMHKLEISLVRTTPESEEWKRTFQAAYSVYVKYQVAIHGDSLERCTERQFRRFLVESPLQLVLKHMHENEETFQLSAQLFTKYQMAVHNEPADDCDVESFKSFLVDSPLEPYNPANGPRHGYGSFHQQYWLDGNLIAVGVIDILPKCVSSVYFFYDPDYSHLSLGTYGSLREIELTRQLHDITSELQFYYMGYYIHSCPKMRYKANFTPSFLLCPETFSWFPIERCLPAISIHPYARLNEDTTATDPDVVLKIELQNVLVLYNLSGMRYGRLKALFPAAANDVEVLEYANLVGRKCAFRMFLVRSF